MPNNVFRNKRKIRCDLERTTFVKKRNKKKRNDLCGLLYYSFWNSFTHLIEKIKINVSWWVGDIMKKHYNHSYTDMSTELLLTAELNFFDWWQVLTRCRVTVWHTSVQPQNSESPNGGLCLTRIREWEPTLLVSKALVTVITCYSSYKKSCHHQPIFFIYFFFLYFLLKLITIM